MEVMSNSVKIQVEQILNKLDNINFLLFILEIVLRIYNADREY